MPLPNRKKHRLPDDLYRGRVTAAFTLCIDKRKHLFVDHEVTQTHENKLFDHAARHGCRVQIYCFMPDHIHAILSGRTEESDIKASIEGFKRSSGLWLATNRPNVCWQVGYHDRILRDYDEFRNQVLYCFLNPVRAGLVERPMDYPFVGSQGRTIEELLQELC